MRDCKLNSTFQAIPGRHQRGQLRSIALSCYYMQEKSVLVEFYQEFVAHQKEDPGGFKTLQRVLAERDMDFFKNKWEKYVLGLNEEFRLSPVRP